MKLRTVMVPLDGSAFAEAALPLGTLIARRSGATLRLVLVHGAANTGGDEAVAAQVALQDSEREYLRATASRVDPGEPSFPKSISSPGPLARP